MAFGRQTWIHEMSTKMNTEQLNSTLRAGGYLLPDTKAPTDVPVDTIDGRIFTHLGIPDREIVRLTPSNLAIGEDAAMDILGFAPVASSAKIALRMRQALGFPEWVLVHDPKNAASALAISRDLKKEARRAKSKPGNAKVVFDEMGKTISTKTPHFLPPFYEEVARAFIESGNTTYAATYFGKAREAEQTYALEVDENRRRDAFVEFALSGALTNKVMSEYAKDLSKRYGAEKAYEYFFDLCVRRTLGGTPPHSQMVTELRRLAKAAGKKQADEDAKFVSEIWEAPSLTRSASAFWETYAKTFAQLAKKEPRIRGRLLNTFPVPSGKADDFKTFWVGLLKDTGADEGLTKPEADVDGALKPEGSAAQWIAKFVSHRMASGYSYYRKPTTPDAGFDLIRRMAPRLKADGNEFEFAGSGWQRVVDIDVLDLLIELEIPVKVPDAIDFTSWSVPMEGMTERLRDLKFLGGDTRFDKVVDGAVGAVFGNAEFEAAARGKAGLKRAREKWLERRAEQIGDGATPSFKENVARLRSATSAATFKEFPKAWARLQKLELVAPFTRTLNGGFLDEYQWVEAKTAYNELRGPKHDVEVKVAGVFPYLILHSPTKGIVVGPKGRVVEHDFKLPQGQSVKHIAYAGGQLLVVFYDKNWNNRAYWSAKPNHVFDGGYIYHGAVGVERGDGSMVVGPVAFRAGDETMPQYGTVLSDGTSFWTRAGWGDDVSFKEFDPDSGKEGRTSLPAIFEDSLRPDMSLAHQHCELYPVPAELKDSPLGTKDGLYSRMAFQSKNAEYLTVTPLGEHAGYVDAMIRQPGSNGTLSIQAGFRLMDKNDLSLDARSTLSGLPIAIQFAHFLKVSDEAGSKKLRSIKADASAAIVAAAIISRTHDDDAPSALAATWLGEIAAQAGKSSKSLPAFVAAGKGHLEGDKSSKSTLSGLMAAGKEFLLGKSKAPTAQSLQGIIDEVVGCNAELRASIALLAEEYADSLVALARHIEASDPAHAGAIGTAIVDTAVWGSFSGVASGSDYNFYNYSWGEQADLGRYITQLGKFLTSGEIPKDIAWTTTDVSLLLTAPASIGWLASSPGLTGDREVLLSFLDQMGTSGIFDLPGKFRLFTSPRKGWVSLGAADENRHTFLITHEGHKYVGRSSYYGNEEFTVLEYAGNGEFKTPNGVTIEAEWAAEGWSGAAAKSLVELVRERGPYEINTEIISYLAEKIGVSQSEAGLLWATMPNMNSYEKNFLPKEIREAMGVKVAEAAIARDAVKQLSAHKKLAVYAAGMPEDVANLWDQPTRAADSLAAAWTGQFGQRVQLPGALLAEIKKNLGIWDPREPVKAILSPKNSIYSVVPDYELQSTDGKCLEMVAKDQKFNGIDNVNAFLKIARYVSLNAPVGDEVRKSLPAAWEVWKTTLNAPGFQVSAPCPYDYEYDKLKEALARIGTNKSLKGLEYYQDDLVTISASQWSLDMMVRVAPVLAGKTSPHFAGLKELPAVNEIFSDRFAAMMKNVSSPSVEAGSYETNAELSVPKLVDTVAKKLGVSSSAANAFLQILALPNPTTSNVKTWNGWTTGAYKKAMAELLAKGLVMEAKRSRAGRTHFLDGPWLDLKAPHLPVEGWKSQFYGTDYTESLGQQLPLEAVPVLFQRAWDRWSSGDKPKF